MSTGDATFTVRGVAAASARRDRAAEVSALVEREAGHLLNYFLRRTSTAEDAADLVGETLLVVWRRERSIPPNDVQARMWMFGVARKVLTDQRRSSTRRTALTQRLAGELTAAAPHPIDDGLADVRALIDRLDETDREIIRLVYWDGFSLAETAQLLHLRAPTVRSRHARARAKLRDELQRVRQTP